MNHPHLQLLSLLLMLTLSTGPAVGVVALPQFNSKNEEKMLVRQAIEGSLEAAVKVARVYLLEIGNKKLYWSLIAAENGSVIGAYNVSSILFDVASLDYNPYGEYRLDRIWFWLKKAADGGNSDAILMLRSQFTHPEKMGPEPEVQIRKWVLQEATLAKFKHAAMRGSREAAFRLYKRYSSPEIELKKGLFWATIAAQNGHQNALFIVGRLMLKSSIPTDKQRGIFWLRKSAAAGDKEAADLLRSSRNRVDGLLPK